MSEQIRLIEAKREEYWKKHEEYLVRDVFTNCTIGSPLMQQEIYSLWVGCAENDVKMYQYLGFEIPLGNLLAWSVD